MSRELFNVDAEFGLLGAMFVDPLLVDEIASKVSIADFHEIENAALFRAILDCHEAGDPVNVVMVSEHHQYLPSGDSMLGYAATIQANAQGTSSWKTYARVIRERAVLRKVVETAQAISQPTTICLWPRSSLAASKPWPTCATWTTANRTITRSATC